MAKKKKKTKKKARKKTPTGTDLKDCLPPTSKCSCPPGTGCNDETPLISDVTPKLIEAGSTEADRSEDNETPINNLFRAHRAFDAVGTYWGSDGNDDIGQIIGDMVCDLQHLCRMLGVDWKELAAKSGRCNDDEVAGGV